MWCLNCILARKVDLSLFPVHGCWALWRTVTLSCARWELSYRDCISLLQGCLLAIKLNDVRKHNQSFVAVPASAVPGNNMCVHNAREAYNSLIYMPNKTKLKGTVRYDQIQGGPTAEWERSCNAKLEAISRESVQRWHQDCRKSTRRAETQNRQEQRVRTLHFRQWS